MENASTEVYLAAHSEMVKEIADHQLVVIFTKDHVDADKPVPVVILSPVSFIGGSTRSGRTGSIQGSWDPERSAVVITMVGTPVEKDLADIGMKNRNVVIHMKCDG